MHERRRLLLLAAVAVALMAGDAVFGLCDGALHLVPFLMLLVPLLLGGYVGERAIARWRDGFARARTPRRASGDDGGLRRRAHARDRRLAGVIVGLALASRPPPVGVA